MHESIEKLNFYIITGCSGGGKSSLLAALKNHHMICVEEAGRHIVRQQNIIGGDALPSKNTHMLCELILSHNIYNFERMLDETKPVFFDRGIPEAIGYDHFLGRGPLPHHIKASDIYRYNKNVFVLPPWREIFVNDAERKHSFAEAEREYHLQNKVYRQCGYHLIELPKSDVEARAQFVLKHILG
jgi:predicted ATPase